MPRLRAFLAGAAAASLLYRLYIHILGRKTYLQRGWLRCVNCVPSSLSYLLYSTLSPCTFFCRRVAAPHAILCSPPAAARARQHLYLGGLTRRTGWTGRTRAYKRYLFWNSVATTFCLAETAIIGRAHERPDASAAARTLMNIISRVLVGLATTGALCRIHIVPVCGNEVTYWLGPGRSSLLAILRLNAVRAAALMLPLGRWRAAAADKRTHRVPGTSVLWRGRPQARSRKLKIAISALCTGWVLPGPCLRRRDVLAAGALHSVEYSRWTRRQAGTCLPSAISLPFPAHAFRLYTNILPSACPHCLPACLSCYMLPSFFFFTSLMHLFLCLTVRMVDALQVDGLCLTPAAATTPPCRTWILRCLPRPLPACAAHFPYCRLAYLYVLVPPSPSARAAPFPRCTVLRHHTPPTLPPAATVNFHLPSCSCHYSGLPSATTPLPSSFWPLTLLPWRWRGGVNVRAERFGR